MRVSNLHRTSWYVNTFITLHLPDWYPYHIMVSWSTCRPSRDAQSWSDIESIITCTTDWSCIGTVYGCGTIIIMDDTHYGTWCDITECVQSVLGSCHSVVIDRYSIGITVIIIVIISSLLWFTSHQLVVSLSIHYYHSPQVLLILVINIIHQITIIHIQVCSSIHHHVISLLINWPHYCNAFISYTNNIVINDLQHQYATIKLLSNHYRVSFISCIILFIVSYVTMLLWVHQYIWLTICIM